MRASLPITIPITRNAPRKKPAFCISGELVFSVSGGTNDITQTAIGIATM